MMVKYYYKHENADLKPIVTKQLKNRNLSEYTLLTTVASHTFFSFSMDFFF